MDKVRIIEVKQSIFENNDRDADKLREELKEKKTFLLNLMSSPGSGKTTFLKGIIKRLKDEIAIGVMEADIDSDVDALAITSPWLTESPTLTFTFVRLEYTLNIELECWIFTTQPSNSSVVISITLPSYIANTSNVELSFLA